MNNKKCYICEKPLDDEEAFVIKFDDESFDLCEQHYQTSQKTIAHIDKRKKELEGKICCKNYGKGCEYDSAWFCKNPDCITPVITSTLVGAFCVEYETPEYDVTSIGFLVREGVEVEVIGNIYDNPELIGDVEK